jgi:membrane protein required for beta-lactamase induction
VLNREQVVAIVGHVEEAMIAQIIETGADEAALLEAHARLNQPGEVGEETERPLEGVVSELYEILRAGEPEWDESHDRD